MTRSISMKALNYESLSMIDILFVFEGEQSYSYLE